MRKVAKKFNRIPAKLSSPECANLIEDSLITKGKHKFQTAVYGHTSVRTALDRIYLSKCAFCETDPSAGVTMQVEHYRPKAKVTEDATHGGYYWLAYQWSNLLLACPACNNKKRNRFPINNAIRAKIPLKADGSLDLAQCTFDATDLVAENALLVNPETDTNPMQHFRFQATGEIEHKTEAGKNTIEVCGLNRGRLIKKRKKVYDTLLNKLMINLAKNAEGKLSDAKLTDRIEVAIVELIDYIINAENEYIEFAKTCWNEFDGFYIARFQPVQKQKIQPIYDKIRAEFDAI